MQAKHPYILNKNIMENRKKENVGLVFKSTENGRVGMLVSRLFPWVNVK